jgi:hypothetical protein
MGDDILESPNRSRETRTPTGLLPTDFKSGVSTDSTILPYVYLEDIIVYRRDSVNTRRDYNVSYNLDEILISDPERCGTNDKMCHHYKR